MYEAPRTPTTSPQFLWTANITAQSTVSEVAGGSSFPAAVANESGSLEEAPPNSLGIQVYSEAGAILDLAVFGISREARTGLWLVEPILQATVTMSSTAGGISIFGDTLYPALTHTVNLCTTNARQRDGSASLKMRCGSIQVDFNGLQRPFLRLNTQSSTKKANIALRPF